MNPSLHLSTLRACAAHLAAHGWRGKRRDEAAHTFMLGALALSTAMCKEVPWTKQAEAEDAILVDLIRQRGYRELKTQLHALTLATQSTTRGKTGDDI